MSIKNKLSSINGSKLSSLGKIDAKIDLMAEILQAYRYAWKLLSDGTRITIKNSIPEEYREILKEEETLI